MPANVTFEKLKFFCSRAFQAAGMNYEHSEVCADVLATADAMGFYSHGTANAYSYIAKAKAGGVDFRAQPTILIDLPSLALVDAHNALGIVASAFAMSLACTKATKTGIAMASVKNSSHFGAAGYYSNMAAKQGMFGLVMSNVDPNMAIPGAKGKALGNNPISFAAPTSSHQSIFLDISTSATAYLKVMQAKEVGAPIPDGWLIDKNGVPTNDPSDFPNEGALQSMGQHKGYGLSVMVECLTGVLTGCGTSASGTIPSWCFDLDAANNVSHSFIVIDVARLCPENDYRDQIERFISDLHSIPTIQGAQPIHAPGEGAWARYQKAMNEGIDLPSAALSSIRQIEAEYNISLFD